MKSTRALALGLLVGVLAACGQPSAPSGAGASGDGGWITTGPPHFVTHGDLRLDAILSFAPDAATGRLGLAVYYRLLNDGAEPMLVHDHVPLSLGSATLPEDLDPTHAWVFMSGSRIRVSKQGFAPAPGVRFMAAPVMGARVLEASGMVTGEAWAPLPATLDVPGAEFDAPRAPLDPNASEWEFCLQVTEGAQGRPSGVDPDVLEVPAAAPGDGELICSEPMRLPSEPLSSPTEPATPTVSN
jgi:hypothetical protein